MIGEPSEMISHVQSKTTLPLASPKLVLSKHRKSTRALREIQLPNESVIKTNTEGSEPVNSTGRLIIIEGNIGVGKTTLATNLSSELSCKVFVEPAIENPYLEKFYKEPHKYALPLQLWILQQRYQTYVNAAKHIIKTGESAILDRSVFSDVVFANVCHREGYITERGYDRYLYWRNKAVQFLPLPHVTLYLDATPECCLERIHSRGRECEGGVPLDYLTKLHREYSVFCEDMRTLGSALVRCDWCNFHQASTVHNEIIKQSSKQWSAQVVRDFIEKHSKQAELLPVSELQATCE